MSKYLAEGVGTFALVFCGCGAIVVNDLYGHPLGHLGVSLVFGLVVMVMIYAVGNISGAHFNPAVTLGFVFAGRIGKKEIVPYVGAQAVGAVVASVVLRLMFPDHGYLGATLPAGSPVQALVLEVLLSFVLMFVILNVSTGHMEKGIMAGVAVGGTVALAALFGGPVSGASMNPVRSIAPALISGQLEYWWIYVVAPVLGAYLAHPTRCLIQGEECCAVQDP
jgi:MIP family channel proteins